MSPYPHFSIRLFRLWKPILYVFNCKLEIPSNTNKSLNFKKDLFLIFEYLNLLFQQSTLALNILLTTMQLTSELISIIS